MVDRLVITLGEGIEGDWAVGLAVHWPVLSLAWKEEEVSTPFSIVFSTTASGCPRTLLNMRPMYSPKIPRNIAFILIAKSSRSTTVVKPRISDPIWRSHAAK